MNRPGMAGRFSTRRFAPDAAPLPIPEEEVPQTLEGISWTVFPEEEERPAVVTAPIAAAAPTLKSDKLLDAKVRLHRRLLEELNLAALEKLPENEMRQHVQQL